jgi:hypothetical protein
LDESEHQAFLRWNVFEPSLQAGPLR